MKKTISAEFIENMNYVDFISFLGETNRCPGGKDTIRKILHNSFVNQNSKVLEIGCNTGFTTMEIARVTGSQVIGIDVSGNAVDVAKQQLVLEQKHIQKRVVFHVGDATNIPYKDNTFDLVVAGGAFSFIHDKKIALKEVVRVCKPWKYIAFSNLFYHKKPPRTIVNEVEKCIGIPLNTWDEKDWIKFYLSCKELSKYYFELNKLYSVTSKEIERYVDFFLEKEHIAQYDHEIKYAIKKKWLRLLDVFNMNHKYLGFLVFILRKQLINEEISLFNKYKTLTSSSDKYNFTV